MIRNSQISLAISAVIGAAFVTACHSTASGASATPSSASSSPAPSAASSASSPSSASSASSPGGSQSASPVGSASSVGSSGETVPGVIDCGKSLSKLEVQPTSLLLVCSDGTAGLKDLTWSHWGHNITTGSPGQSVIPAPDATGTGEFFLNDCTPNCAQGHDRTYPVRVTLSVVYSSPRQGGTYFGQASLTWEGNRPPAGTKTTYLLPDPGSS